jgi:hypothetical protein
MVGVEVKEDQIPPPEFPELPVIMQLVMVGVDQ